MICYCGHSAIAHRSLTYKGKVEEVRCSYPQCRCEGVEVPPEPPKPWVRIDGLHPLPEFGVQVLVWRDEEKATAYNPTHAWRIRNLFHREPIRGVRCMKLWSVSENWPTWITGRTPNGSPIGEVWDATFWRPLPKGPFEVEE